MLEDQGRGDAPKISDSVQAGPERPDPISGSPAGKLLNNFLATLDDVGEEAQERYEVTLSELREHAADVVIEIARASTVCGEDDYPMRWALIHAAAEMRHPAALPFLSSIVLTPIPPERSKNPHSFSTVAEETILRTTAVEGVEYLAAQGEKEAQEALFGFLRMPSLSVRRASVLAVLATDDSKGARRKLTQLLPEDQRFLLDVKRVNVDEVEQIEDPQSHLAEWARDEAVKAPPRMPDEQEGDTPKVYK